MRLPYLVRLVCAALGGALGIIGAGLAITTAEHASARRRHAQRSGQVLHGHVIAEFEHTSTKFRRRSA